MLVAVTKTGRHEAENSKSIQDEHLLERISILENNFTRLTDRVSEVLDLVMKQSQSLSFDHSLLETLIVLLCEAGQINPVQLKAEWHKRRQESEREGQKTLRVNTARRKVMEAFGGTELEQFTKITEQAFALISDDKLAAGMILLEKAAALDTGNSPLHFILGRHFFAEGKLSLAESYLERAAQSASPVVYVDLLLGLVYDELGDAERALKHLSEARQTLGAVFPTEVVSGKLAAADGHWADALKYFKKARSIKPCLEADFLLGLAYFARGFYKAALRCLAQAFQDDTEQAEVCYLAGLIFGKLNERKAAKEQFQRAVQLAPRNAFFRRALSGQKNAQDEKSIDYLLKTGRRTGKNEVFFISRAVIEEALAISAPF